MSSYTLDDIFKDDADGLLDSKPIINSHRTENERLVESFLEINDFIEKNKREPSYDTESIKEYTLASRLSGIRADQSKIKLLLDFDDFTLLDLEKGQVTSVEGILEDDDFGLLNNDNESIFRFRHVPQIDRESTDFVARRNPIKDFSKYEPMFKKVHEELKTGKRSIHDYYSEDQLLEGHFYIANGIIFLLEKVKITRVDHYKSDGTRVRRDGRTRCVFENGLYSNMLFRSVSKLLYSDGKIITTPGESLLDSIENISTEDIEEGYIYILKSLSSHPDLKRYGELYKIGYSKGDVRERISNSDRESAYLMDQIELVKVYRCYNLNPQKLEHILHVFFREVQLLIDIYDDKGSRHSPREWFAVPLEVIEKAVRIIISGDILDYRYDGQAQKIVSK